MKRNLLLGAVVLGFMVFPGLGLAATLSITLDKTAISIGDTFSATVRINSEDASVNAAQAVINFSKDKFQVVSIDKNSSVFNLWLQDPGFDNTAGQITFIGGSSSGFVGKALEALKINLKATGSGSANFTFSDAAITAADGSGTSLLSGMTGAQFTIGTIPGAPAPVQVQPTPPPSQAVPPPTQIKRPATPATTVASKPALTVSLYPDQAKWSNVSDKFLVSWTLPVDADGVATAINKDPASAPTVSEGLFDNKYFAALDEGIWYLHVRFHNNLGWGATMHYKISIDTTPPLPFNIRVDESTSTDTPDPTFRFGTSDQPSGIDRYRIKVGNEDLIFTTSTAIKLPLQTPGTYKVVIRAYDLAGNITEESVDLKILPITAPTVSSMTKDTYIGEGPLQIGGGTATGTTVSVSLKGENGDLISPAQQPAPDQNGNWSTSFELPSRGGKYYVEVLAQDKRGALSFPVKAPFEVRPRPLFVFLGLEVTSGLLAVMLFILLLGGFVAGYYTQKLAKEQRGRRAIIAERDISVVFGLLRKDVDKMISDYEDGTLTAEESKEIEFYLKRMRDNLDKTKRYLSENVEEIKE